MPQRRTRKHRRDEPPEARTTLLLVVVALGPNIIKGISDFLTALIAAHH